MSQTVYTEATSLLEQVRARLTPIVAAQIAEGAGDAPTLPAMAPAETGGASLAGTSAEPQVAGSGQDTPAYSVGAVNEPDVGLTFEKFLASLIAGLMEKHKVSEKDAEGLVFGTIEDFEGTGQLPTYPDGGEADPAYMAAFLGRAKTSGLHYEIWRRAEQEWAGD